MSKRREWLIKAAIAVPLVACIYRWPVQTLAIEAIVIFGPRLLLAFLEGWYAAEYRIEGYRMAYYRTRLKLAGDQSTPEYAKAWNAYHSWLVWGQYKAARWEQHRREMGWAA